MFSLHKKIPLPEIFAKFAGVEIPTKTVKMPARIDEKILSQMSPEEQEEFKSKYPVLANPYEKQKPNDDGVEIIREIYEIAKANNVRLRLMLPGLMGTTDVQHGRMNMRVKKESDGKWRIQPTCDYG